MVKDTSSLLAGKTALVVAVGMLCACMGVFTPAALAVSVDNGIPQGYEPTWYNGIPAQQFKDVFETETVDVSAIRVDVDELARPDDTVTFRIFNSTTQKTERVVDTVVVDGVQYLPAMELKKNHNYIFFCEDEWYCYKHGTYYTRNTEGAITREDRVNNVYVQVLDGTTAAATDGPGAYNYKTTSLFYDKLASIAVYKRDAACADPYEDNRYNTESDHTPYVVYKGKRMPGVTFSLVSDIETLEVKSGASGLFKTELIEDVTYMVYCKSGDYVIDSFPIVAKEKSEYLEGRYCYNHTTCTRVEQIVLYDKGETVFDGRERTTTLKSLKGRTSVSGMNFKQLLLLDRDLDRDVAALQGKDYQVFDVTAVNPRRWEISKLLGTKFTVQHKLPDGKEVASLYCLKDGSLVKVPFSHVTGADGRYVSFRADSISLYPYCMELKPYTPPAPSAADQARKALACTKPTAMSQTAVDAIATSTSVPQVKAPASSVIATSKAKGKQLQVAFPAAKGATNYIAAYREATAKKWTYSTTAGKAACTVKGLKPGDLVQFKVAAAKGGKRGAWSKTLYLYNKSVSSVKATGGKRKLTAKWKKDAKATGYQVLYSTAKSMKGCKTKQVKSKAKTKLVVKGLKKGKKYYVEVRPVKKCKGKTYVGAVGGAKTAKVK